MIQIDMPTPKNCANCCFSTADLINGIITLSCMTPVGRKVYAPDLIFRKDRPKWCPIKEQQNVVRCKDCKYGYRCKNAADEDSVECTNHYVSLDSICRKPDWFCADGERES